MKKGFLQSLLCVLLAFCLLPIPVAAAQPQYIALGDSISGGYLIENEKDRFVNIVADKNGYELTNYAHNEGNTAAGILEQFADNDWDDELAAASLITITCGGNDLMDLLCEKVAEKYNSENDPDIEADEVTTLLADSSNLIQWLKLVSCAQELLEGDPDNGVPAFTDTEEFAAKLNEYMVNMQKVMHHIRGLNGTATVILTTQYNPYKSFAGGTFDIVYVEMEKGANRLSQAIIDQAEELDYLVADVNAAFKADDRNLCNATEDPVNLDFHPNVEGHAVIAACVQKVLDSLPGEDQPDVPVHECPSEKFTDVDQDLWYHEAIDYVLENGIMVGITDTTFEPETLTTRAQIVRVLWNIEGNPAPDGKADFSDVPEDKWYSDAVAWASENGIVSGYGDHTFGPDDSLTREQMAMILYQYAQYKGYDVTTGEFVDLSSFADGDQVGSWAKDCMRWAVAEKIIQGKGNNLLDPKGTARRCEMAQMLYGFLESR